MALGRHFRSEPSEVRENRQYKLNACSLSTRLAEWWKEIFPHFNFVHLRVEESPMLIGGMRRPLISHMESFPFDYQFRVLLHRDLLIGTEQRSSPINALNTLFFFRENWFQSEELLVSV